MPSGSWCLEVGDAFKGFEASRRRPRQAWCLSGPSADDEEVEPSLALFVGGHGVHSLEDDFLDAAVRRDLDGVPDRQAVRGDLVMRFIDAPVHRQPHRLGQIWRAY